MPARCEDSPFCSMGRMHGLRLWHAAREFSEDVLNVAAQLPIRDLAKLRSQLATAAHSVSSNIAEGAGRNGSTRERAQFLRIARGSLDETQNHLRVAVNAGFL